MTPDDKKFLREIASNPEFQRVFTLFTAEEKARQLDYMQDCIRQNPPRFEEAIRSEASATTFGDMLQAILTETKPEDR